MRYFNITEAAKLLNVHPQSLRNWDNNGSFVAMRTPGGQRRYSESQIEEFGKKWEQEKKTDLS